MAKDYWDLIHLWERVESANEEFVEALKASGLSETPDIVEHKGELYRVSSLGVVKLSQRVIPSLRDLPAVMRPAEAVTDPEEDDEETTDFPPPEASEALDCAISCVTTDQD